MNHIKNAWKSLTIWFNGVSAMVISGMPMLSDTFPQMQPYMTPQFYQWVGGIVVASNILLRFKTCKSLAEK